MMNIAIFASGSGSNAENIIKHFNSDSQVNVCLVVSNKTDAYVHKRAEMLGVKSYSFPKHDFDEADKILSLLAECNVDFVILAGFLLKVSAKIIGKFPNKILNIHPALLPKFGGKGMYGDNVHKAVVDAQEKESGITIHYVNENYDEGNIIFQAKCDVLPSDTFEDVANKVHELEYLHFPKIIEEVIKRTSN